MSDVDGEWLALGDRRVDSETVVAALAEFDAVWDALTPREQSRVIEFLVESATYHAKAGSVSITFRTSGTLLDREKIRRTRRDHDRTQDPIPMQARRPH